LFVEARSDAEESAYSRNAVRLHSVTFFGGYLTTLTKFYNLAIFMSSIAVFSLVAQRMATGKVIN
jgi:hypothetical protein